MSITFLQILIWFTFFLSSVCLFAQGAWQTQAPLPTPRTEVAAAELDGKIYVFGGILESGAATDVVEVYDIAQDRWTAAAPLPLALHHIGAATVDGKIYAVGGLGGGFVPVNTLFEYDPATNQWSRKADLTAARGAMAVAVANGKIYAIGGQKPGTVATTDNIQYDPQTNRWQEWVPMPTPREHAAAATIDGKIYVAGGRQGFLATNLRTLEVYDPAAFRWKSLPDMPTARSGIAAAALNGRLYVFGGESAPGTFNQNEEFDPVTETWRAMAPMPTARHGLGAISFGGKIYVLGGGPQPNLSVSDAHEVFTPPTTRVEEAAATVQNFRLFQSYPNPWSRSSRFPQTTIRYRLPETAKVSVSIYNALGQRVRLLLRERAQSAGEHSVNWDGRNDAEKSMHRGIYFYKLQTGKQAAWGKLVVME
jgi:N-acetylneuraminic acid mutarotase